MDVDGEMIASAKGPGCICQNTLCSSPVEFQVRPFGMYNAFVTNWYRYSTYYTEEAIVLVGGEGGVVTSHFMWRPSRVITSDFSDSNRVMDSSHCIISMELKLAKLF